MENIDKPKIKTIFKNENRLNNPSLKGDKNESDSSDSNILEDLQILKQMKIEKLILVLKTMETTNFCKPIQ